MDGGQVERQLRVGEHRLGQQQRREDDLLDVRHVVADDGRASDFRSGSGGRRQRDEPGDGRGDRAHLRMVPRILEDVAVVVRHQRDGLGHVQRGAAADADDRIRAMRLVRGRAGHHLAAHRVAEDLREHADGETGQVGDQRGEQRQRGDAAIGDQQRARDALRLQVVGDELARAGAEMDGGREAEAFDAHGALRGKISQEKDHVFFVEIRAGDLDGTRFHAERHEAGRAIELGRGAWLLRVTVSTSCSSPRDAPRVVDHRLQQLRAPVRVGRTPAPRTSRRCSPCGGSSRAPRASGRRCPAAARRRTRPRTCCHVLRDRCSVAASGFCASSSKLDVKASACSFSARSRSSRNAVASARVSIRTDIRHAPFR